MSNASSKIAKISELGVSNAFRATRRQLGHYTRLACFSDCDVYILKEAVNSSLTNGILRINSNRILILVSDI